MVRQLNQVSEYMLDCILKGLKVSGERSGVNMDGSYKAGMKLLGLQARANNMDLKRDSVRHALIYMENEGLVEAEYRLTKKGREWAKTCEERVAEALEGDDD